MTSSDSSAAAPQLDKDGSVAVLSLGSGENRLHAESIAELLELFDEVEASDFTALVTTADGKIWSNGFDTEWIAANPGRCAESIEAGERLFARVLSFPMPTVAVVQGHAFAAGLMLALSHDLRIMREDRGFLCLPEVAFSAVFSAGMTELLTARMTPQTAHRAMVLGHRFPAPEALAVGLVDEIAPVDELLGRAVAVAGQLGGRDRTAVAALKRRVYDTALNRLAGPAPQDLVDALLTLGRP